MRSLALGTTEKTNIDNYKKRNVQCLSTSACNIVCYKKPLTYPIQVNTTLLVTRKCRSTMHTAYRLSACVLFLFSQVRLTRIFFATSQQLLFNDIQHVSQSVCYSWPFAQLVAQAWYMTVDSIDWPMHYRLVLEKLKSVRALKK